ncbi:MAG: hypothetical protein IRY85_15915, partial [Micromonosporaceae bacterium]|nr:hypothetical protein [Micromonosporaceae bacterium]
MGVRSGLARHPGTTTGGDGAARADAAARADVGTRPKLLVVEDDPNIVELLSAS